MGFEMGWHKVKRSIKVLIDGDVTLTEVGNLNRKLLQLISEGDQPVHVLIDATLVNRFPSTVLQVKNLLTFLEAQDLGMVVFVDQTQQGNMLTHILSQILGEHYCVFGSHKAATEYLKAQDPSMGWFNGIQVKLPWAVSAQPSGNLPSRA